MQLISVNVGKDFTLLPAGCLHWPIGEKELLKKWVDELRSTPNGYGILMGDSLDVARTHYRNHIRGYRDDDNSQEAFDAYVREEVGRLANVLAPVKRKILGVIRGNHYWEFTDGTDSEQELCRRLGLRYLGALSIVQLKCSVKKGRTNNLNIFAHHTGGSSGGRTLGGDVNALTRQENAWNADIYLLGHTHRRIAFKESVMNVSDTGELKVIEKTKVFARTGAFLKGFKEGHIPVNSRYTPSYAEEKAYRPTDLGWVKIHVRWREKSGVSYPDYTLEY